MNKLQLGLNLNISNEAYHSDREYISSSGLKKILYSTQDYYNTYILGEASADIPAFAVGTYVHTYILEPHLLEETTAVYKGVRRGERWETFKIENAGKVIITEAEENKIAECLTAYAQDITCKPLFKGEPEVTLATNIDGVGIKVRCDLLQRGTHILDVKTTSKHITYENILMACFDYDYDLSAALYLDAFNQFLPEEEKVKDFIFYFLGKSDGKVKAFKASKEFIENGRKKYLHAIEILKRCRETGDYSEKLQLQELGVPEEFKYVV